MTAAEIVRATGVTKGFAAAGGRGRTEAVRGVNFTVGQGELVVLLGRSGAGKSTLLSLVGGIDSPDAGTIVVAGQDVGGLHGRSREEYLRRTVGWMFQSAGLLPLLSAQENVWLAARLACERPGQSAFALVRPPASTLRSPSRTTVTLTDTGAIH